MPIAGLEVMSRANSPTIGVLASGLIGRSMIGDQAASISEIEYDSRRIQSGNLFVALVGSYDDGHEFAADAVERGAGALLVERRLPIDIPQIVVPDTRAALATVAAEFYRHPSRELKVIGITGTDGKTTTSYLTEAIFEAAGFKTGMIGTLGVRIADQPLETTSRQTTPESLEIQRHLRTMVDCGVEVAIVEATSHGLDLHRLDETRFVSAAVTNITHEHLEHHGTIAAYRRAKGILFERIAEVGGTAIVNVDDEGSREMVDYSNGAQVVTYSMLDSTADFYATGVQLGISGTFLTLLRCKQDKESKRS